MMLRTPAGRYPVGRFAPARMPERSAGGLGHIEAFDGDARPFASGIGLVNLSRDRTALPGIRTM